MKLAEPDSQKFDGKEKLDWSDDISMSARFFKVSFRKMLDMIQLVNEIDQSLILENLADKSHASILACIAAQQRIEGRLRFIEFRMSFELGHDLPLKNGGSVSFVQWAKDLHAKGAITATRVERALNGLPSEDLELVRSTIEKMRAEPTSPF